MKNFTAGIDVGSLTAKIVILQEEQNQISLLHSNIQKVGYNPVKVTEALLVEAKQQIPSDYPLSYIVATGYGRKLVKEADKIVTEITCHARGIHYINADIRTIIDIGGQDSKVIRINEKGMVQDFEMNDKCSAGTGRFLEVMASALEVELSEFGLLALKSTNPAPISSTCTVFAESEVISRLNQGLDRNDIIAGIHKTIAAKIFALTSRVGIVPLIALTGGVALNSGVKKMLEELLNEPLYIASDPQITGALGAAIIALKHLKP